MTDTQIIYVVVGSMLICIGFLRIGHLGGFRAGYRKGYKDACRFTEEAIKSTIKVYFREEDLHSGSFGKECSSSLVGDYPLTEQASTLRVDE